MFDDLRCGPGEQEDLQTSAECSSNFLKGSRVCSSGGGISSRDHRPGALGDGCRQNGLTGLWMEKALD